MDAARAAEMSWPDENLNFRRRWGAGPPGPEKRRPALGGTSNRAIMKTYDSDSRNNKPELPTQPWLREVVR